MKIEIDSSFIQSQVNNSQPNKGNIGGLSCPVVISKPVQSRYVCKANILASLNKKTANSLEPAKVVSSPNISGGYIWTNVRPSQTYPRDMFWTDVQVSQT